MQVTRKSTATGTTRTLDIPVDPSDILSWQQGGGSIEELMPYLSDAHREFILSGITPDEWAIAFFEAAE